MNDKERKLQYKEHRRRVENAKSRVDSQAPRPKKQEIMPCEMTFFDLMKALFKHRRQCTHIRSPIRMRSAISIHWKKKSNHYRYGGGGGGGGVCGRNGHSGRSGRSGRSVRTYRSGRSGQSSYSGRSDSCYGAGDHIPQNSGRSVPPTISTIALKHLTIKEPLLHSPITASDSDSQYGDYPNDRRLIQYTGKVMEMKKTTDKINGMIRNRDKDKDKDKCRDKDKNKLMVKINNKIKCADKDKALDKSEENIHSTDNKTKLNVIPPYVMKRYNYLSFLDNIMLRKLFRPSIFFDIELKNERHLGRMIIQLYTEACPEVVCQLVQICTQCDRMRINFTRLYPPLWLEGELLMNDNLNTYTIPCIEYDAAAINHGSSAGILSFPSRYLRGSKYRFISFTVSFKPADVLNGKRIGFGRLKRGQKILNLLQTVNVTRNGRPVKDIIVADCGVL